LNLPAVRRDSLRRSDRLVERRCCLHSSFLKARGLAEIRLALSSVIVMKPFAWELLCCSFLYCCPQCLQMDCSRSEGPCLAYGACCAQRPHWSSHRSLHGWMLQSILQSRCLQILPPHRCFHCPSILVVLRGTGGAVKHGLASRGIPETSSSQHIAEHGCANFSLVLGLAKVVGNS